MNAVKTSNVSTTKRYPQKAPNSRRMYKCPNHDPNDTCRKGGCGRLFQENNRTSHLTACNRKHKTTYTKDDFVYVANMMKGTGEIVYFNNVEDDIDFLENLKAAIDEKDEYINELLTQLNAAREETKAVKKEFRDYQSKVARMKNVMKSLRESISS